MKTDNQLQRDILAELDWDPALDAAAIGVQVSEGIVTLTGQVASFGEKWEAERATQGVAGVQALTVALDVRLPGTSQRDDVDIARTVTNALLWSSVVPAGAVSAMVEAGHVTLSGEVLWPHQRDAAAQAVRNLMGVTGVSDQIAVKPHVTSQGVKDRIDATLKRRAHQDAEQIVATVHGSEVTLTGPVHSWPERRLACHAAWSTAGVHNVIDHLFLS